MNASHCALCGDKSTDKEWIIVLHKKVVCKDCALKINPSVMTYSEYIRAATPNGSDGVESFVPPSRPFIMNR